MRDPLVSIRARLLGISHVLSEYPPKLLWDPFSSRMLPLVISQDLECRVPKFALLQAIKHHPGDRLEYRRLRLEWLPAVNRLLANLFWPGIDGKCIFELVSNCLFDRV